ncbi:hypothetical protein CLIM01_11176 [Colletotrichum limetticola]|uniref:Uncharacterized protein n=1 Tax=Colletotrichum limetticola TaxID=1209924 RepID=A0ABQ9PJU0_9PEZI|nr:hypothetical protein CLIM01_11176 [Colletotrichum limetticola]
MTISRIACLWLLAVVLVYVNALRVEKSQEFPLGSEIENLAVRPSGSILAVVYTFPRVYEVAPIANAEPKLVHTFENTNGVSSIAKSPNSDEYFLITGNFSFQTLSPTPGSYAIHKLSFDKCDKSVVKQLASLDAISQPNGMIAVPGTPYVLIADTREGFIYRFDTQTFQLGVYYDDPLLKPGTTSGVVFGVNGIKLSRGYLYFSNTNQQLVARVKASGNEDVLHGTPEIVATQTPIDDLIVNKYNGDIYLAELSGNALGFVPRGANTTVPETLLGGINSTAILAPTSVVWAKGAEGRTLIASETGGFEQFVTHNYTGGGRINIIHLE